jgi:hypothetical protein
MIFGIFPLELLHGGGGTGLTVKRTLNVLGAMVAAPLIVTVAVYVPTASPVLGRIVNVLAAPFTAMLSIDTL